jgi:hypothetical protein
MRRVFVSLGLPGPPHRRLLLGDADEHHRTVPTLASGRLDQRPGDRLLVVALGEAHHRDVVRRGEAVDRPNVPVSDLAEGSRRRDREPTLPAQELAHPTHRLQLRHVRLQEDPIDTPAGERHMITE